MKIRIKSILLAGGLGLLTAGCESMSSSEPADTKPFAGPGSVSYAATLWSAMRSAELVGSNAINGTPYKGQPPHGAILDTVDTTLTVNGHSGAVIIKRNFGGADISKQAVADNPGKYLKAITVMYKREKGYDSADRDWFWAKYKPDGSLHTNPKGMKLAGRVAKDQPAGCIACHQGAPGGDFVFNNDRYAGG
jgi:hypothetical protein